MKRQFEGQVHLQSVGKVNGISAKNLMLGDVLMWNGGCLTKVVAIEFSASGKTLKVTEENEAGNQYTRRMGADRLVAIHDLAEDIAEATAEEVTEEVTEAPAEEVIEEVSEEATEGARGEIAALKKMTAFERWIKTFFEEKGVDLCHIFTVEHNGYTHILQLDYIIEACIKASKHEQKQIKDTIVKIDFLNGDILHFMNHLATAYVCTNY